MSAQHTPGPWVIVRSGEKDPQPCGIRSDGKATGMICHIPQKHEDVQANARLIAAAPDCLSALQTLIAAAIVVNNLTHASLTEGPAINEALSDLYQATNAARAAVSKATGE